MNSSKKKSKIIGDQTKEGLTIKVVRASSSIKEFKKERIFSSIKSMIGTLNRMMMMIGGKAGHKHKTMVGSKRSHFRSQSSNFIE